MATMSPDQLLGVLNKQAAAFTGSIETGIKTLKSNNAQQEQIYAEQARLTTDSGNSAALIESVKQAGQLTLEASLSRNAAQLGGDLADATGLQAQLSSTYLSAKSAQNNALQAIAAKRATSLFDNPIEWLLNQFTINDDINQHNSALAQANSAAGQIDETNRLITNRAVAAQTLKTSVTEASAAAAVQKVKNDATIVADNYRLQALVTNSNNVQAIISLKGHEMQAAATTYDAGVKQANLANAQAHLALARDAETRQVQEFNWRKEQKAASDKEKAEVAKVGEYIQNNIVNGYKAMYPTQPQKWEVPGSIKLLAVTSGKVPLDGELKQAYEIGVLNSRANPSGDARILATSPTDFLKVMQYNPELDSATKPVRDLIVSTASKVIESPKYQQLVAAKDTVGAERLVNQEVLGAFNRASKLVDGPANPYYIPNITEIAKTSPGVQNFELYKKVIAPLAASGVDLSDPKIVFQHGLQAVKVGTLSPNQFAVDVATIYRQGQRVNIAARQLTSLGIAPLEAYNVKIDTGSMVDSTINMADPKEVLRAVMLNSRSEAIDAFNPLVLGSKLPAIPYEFGGKINSQVPGPKKSIYSGKLIPE